MCKEEKDDDIKYDSNIAEPTVEDMKTLHESMVNLLTTIETNSNGKHYSARGSTASLAVDIQKSMKKITTIVQVIEKVNNNLISINKDYNTVLEGINKLIPGVKGND